MTKSLLPFALLPLLVACAPGPGPAHADRDAPAAADAHVAPPSLGPDGGPLPPERMTSCTEVTTVPVDGAFPASRQVALTGDGVVFAGGARSAGDPRPAPPTPLLHLPRAGGPPVQVATLPPQASFYSGGADKRFSVAGDRLYFALEEEQAKLPRTLHAVRLSDGGVEAIAEVTSGFIARVVASEDAVYWTWSGIVEGRSVDQVRRTPAAGGATEIVVDDFRHAGFAVDRDAIYLWNLVSGAVRQDIQIFRRPKGAPSSERPALLARAPAHEYVDVALTHDDTHLYWTDYDRVQRLPKIGGEIETVAVAATNVPQTIAVDDGYVYWVDAQFGSFRLAGKGRLRAIRKRDGALVDLLGAERILERVFADGRDVWLLVVDGTRQQLHRLRGWQACHGAGDEPR